MTQKPSLFVKHSRSLLTAYPPCWTNDRCICINHTRKYSAYPCSTSSPFCERRSWAPFCRWRNVDETRARQLPSHRHSDDIVFFLLSLSRGEWNCFSRTTFYTRLTSDGNRSLNSFRVSLSISLISTMGVRRGCFFSVLISISPWSSWPYFSFFSSSSSSWRTGFDLLIFHATDRTSIQ